MVTIAEILKGKGFETIPEEHQKNLLKLLDAVNIIRKEYNKAFIVTSGYRSMEEHLRIYKNKGITDKSKIPMKSRHLYGLAVDISDPKLEITKYLKQNPELLEKADLYCEDGNANWVHFQCVPFGSYKKGGSRWFKP
jgi:hypothetical protein